VKGRLAVAMALVAITTYWNSLSTPFLFDDFASIRDNPTIRQLWPISVPLSPPNHGESVSGRPIVNLSLAANYALGGLDVRGYHLWNIVVHVLCALLVFGIIHRTLLRFKPDLVKVRTALATSIALIWMVHPLQTEAVTYVIGRTESMMALFYLLTLYSSIRTIGQDGSRLWTVTAVVSCGLGMATKEAMVTAPLMVALYDRIFVFDSWSKTFRSRRGLYAALAATWLVLAAITWSSPRAHSAGFQSSEELRMVTSPWGYLLNQSVMITRYLRLSFWPRRLVLDYGFIQPLTLGDVAPYAVLVLLLLAATIVALIKRPRLGFLGAWFFVTLAPTSSIVPVVTEVGAERRMYLPSLAIVTLVVVGGRALLRRAGVPKGALIVGVVALNGLLVVGTLARNADYGSELVMWQTVVDRWPGGRAHLNLASALQAAGRKDEMMPHLREATRDLPDAHYDLGAQLLARGSYDEAINELEQFLRDRPTHRNAGSARKLIGEAHAKLGDRFLAKEDFANAGAQYQMYLSTNPNGADGWQNLGVALAAQGRVDEAVGAFEHEVALEPQSGAAHRNLANALLTGRNFQAAVEHARQAVTLQPNDPIAHDLFGLSLAGLGRLDEAAQQFREALAIDPRDAEIRDHLATLTRVAPYRAAP
jgi:tetratricopeptide (TPR) repeat protein